MSVFLFLLFPAFCPADKKQLKKKKPNLFNAAKVTSSVTLSRGTERKKGGCFLFLSGCAVTVGDTTYSQQQRQRKFKQLSFQRTEHYTVTGHFYSFRLFFKNNLRPLQWTSVPVNQHQQLNLEPVPKQQHGKSLINISLLQISRLSSDEQTAISKQNTP